jgi:hypothetical protein
MLGAAGGGFVGHKLGGGLLGTAGGALVGAAGMNLANKAYVCYAWLSAGIYWFLGLTSFLKQSQEAQEAS